MSAEEIQNLRERLREEFAALLAREPDALVSTYLAAFGPTLSPRLACELSNSYRQSDEARGLFRPAVSETARGVVRLAWLRVLGDPARTGPVVLLTGGGPGSGKHTALTAPLRQLRQEFTLVYEASGDPLEEVEALVREAHASGRGVVVLHLDRPLERAARAAVVRSLRERQPPDMEEFAASHARGSANLLRLVRKFSRERDRFAAALVANPGGRDGAHPADLRSAKHLTPSVAHACAVFGRAYEAVAAGVAPPADADDPAGTPALPNPPRRGKSMSRQAAMAAHLVAEGLRQRLALSEMDEVAAEVEEPARLRELAREVAERAERERAALAAVREEQPEAERESQQPGSPPVKELLHQRGHGSREDAERATRLREQTAVGQEEMLDRELPEQVVLRERKTQEHTWEYVRVR